MSSQKRRKKAKSKNYKPTIQNLHDKKEEIKRANTFFFILKIVLYMLGLLAVMWLFKKKIDLRDMFLVILFGVVWLIVYFLSPLIYKTTYKQATKPLTNSRVIISCLAIDIVLQVTFTLSFYLSGWLVAAVISFCIINSIFIWIYISGKKAGRF